MKGIRLQPLMDKATSLALLPLGAQVLRRRYNLTATRDLSPSPTTVKLEAI